MGIRELVSTRLKQAREEAGLTQEELATRLGITQVGYSGLERGRTLVSLETLAEVCRVVGKPITFFTGMGEVEMEGVSPATRELVGIMENLPDREKRAILGYARFVAQEGAQELHQE
jgi:transcriptional regulator with XRE-family HTH domain